jgi:hypothetical protein
LREPTAEIALLIASTRAPWARASGASLGFPHEDLDLGKIVIFERKGKAPATLAFLLSQASLIKDLSEEEFEVGPYPPYQIRIREIEDKTKMDFGELRTFDPLEQEENEGYFEIGTDAVPLGTLADIVV